MFINSSLGNGSGSGGNTTVNVTGSQNSIVQTSAEMNNIISPKNGDVCYVVTDKILYMYNNGAWTTIPTGDMFYNKLASTSDVGHVQLTSDNTLDTEDKAITPKALNIAIAEIKSLIDGDKSNEGWGDFDDGIDAGEGENGYEWGSFE